MEVPFAPDLAVLTAASTLRRQQRPRRRRCLHSFEPDAARRDEAERFYFCELNLRSRPHEYSCATSGWIVLSRTFEGKTTFVQCSLMFLVGTVQLVMQN